MNKTLLVLIGSGLGGTMRYWLSIATQTLLGKGFPYGTLTVNILGSFCIGFFAMLFLGRSGSFIMPLRYLLIIGFMGGFTTFSSFSLETLELLEKGATVHGLANIALSVCTCLVAVWIGSVLGKQL